MTASKQLADFCCSLKFEDIPEEVVERTLELFLDWYGSCLAGSGSPQALVFREFAEEMGGGSGVSRFIGAEGSSSPLFAAMVNAAASHVVEQDDLHNRSVLHPATVVFPPVLAVAQSDEKFSGKDFITAAVAGYEAGIRVGEFLGRSHYRVFHTTGTAGTLASSMAVANLIGLDKEQTLNALGSAGTQAAGLWEFLKDAADSKQLHTAKAAGDGLLAAYTARMGLSGARDILGGEKGLGVGLNAEGTEKKELLDELVNDLGSRWALMETSFKFHSSCRHTHPAADALLEICNAHSFDLEDVVQVRAYVYQAAEDVLGAVKKPVTIHQSKFSMGFVLGLIAVKDVAGVSEFTEAALSDEAVLSFHDKVVMIVDNEIEAAYPVKWCARVEVELRSGEVLSAFVDTPRGDPGNMLSRDELEAKAYRLVDYYGVCERGEMERIIGKVWGLCGAISLVKLF